MIFTQNKLKNDIWLAFKKEFLKISVCMYYCKLIINKTDNSVLQMEPSEKR